MPEEITDAGETATYLVPKMGEFAVSNTAFFESLFLTKIDQPEDKLKPLSGQIDPFADFGADAGSTSPAMGVLLTHEQGWFQKGLALGELLHSLCLAPGEVTKVAVVNWERRTAATSSSSTAQSEAVSAESDQRLGTTEVQNAVATELQTGISTNMNVASQSQAGGTLGFWGGGVSASTSLSSSLGRSTSLSTGARNLSAESSRDITQRTEQASHATRSRRSTQVREINETESSEASTRVVANYNRQHAMTVQYYEVLQVYELKTRVANAERCVYIPMQILDVAENIDRFRETLVAIASDLGLDDLRERLVLAERQLTQGNRELEELTTEADRVRNEELVPAQEAYETHRRTSPRNPEAEAQAREITRTLTGGHFKPEIYESQLRILMMPERLAWTTEHQRLQHAAYAARARWEAAKSLVAVRRSALQVTEDGFKQYIRRDNLLLNQLMWMRLDSHRVHRLLETFTVEGERLGGLVDPKPLGVFGNYVAFRWHFDPQKTKERDAFLKQYIIPENDAVQARVVLPSEGVFAEAVLGQSNSAEKIDVTRFWDWDSAKIPILPPEMAPVSTDSRAQDVAMPSGALESALAALPQLQGLPGSDLSAILTAVQSGNIFRDMSGLDQLTDLAKQTSANASEGASQALSTALEAQKAHAEAVINLANSDAGKAAMQLAMTAVPGGKAATMMGGLMNAASKSGATEKVVSAAGKTAAPKAVASKTADSKTAAAKSDAAAKTTSSRKKTPSRRGGFAGKK